MVVIESHQTEHFDTGRIETQQSKKHSKTHLANLFQSLLFAQARVLRQLVCHANPLLRLHLSAKVEGFDTKVVGMDSSVVDVRFRVLSTAGFDSLEDFIPYQEWPMLRLNIMASMLHAEHDTEELKISDLCRLLVVALVQHKDATICQSICALGSCRMGAQRLLAKSESTEEEGAAGLGSLQIRFHHLPLQA